MGDKHKYNYKKNMKTKKDLFFNKFILLFKYYTLGIAILTISRVVMLIEYGNFEELKLYKIDLLKAFFVGFKFDTVAISYSLATVLIITVVAPFISNKKTITNKIIRILITFIYGTYIYILMLNYFFYQFFKSNIDVRIFGLIDDDTTAVLKSMWTDFPVVKMHLFLVVVIFLTYKALKKIQVKEYYFEKKTLATKIISSLLLVTVIALGMRGSTKMFPLSENDMHISENDFINKICANGIVILQYTFVNKKKYSFNTDLNVTLKRYGFKNISEAYSIYFDEGANKSDILSGKTNTNTFLEENPPNVIFILMESMSGYFFDMHDDEFNLLGDLANEMDSLVVFKNFLSATNGTIGTLEFLLINNIESTLSQTPYVANTFSASVATPFQKKGYKTVFGSNIKLGWRNIGELLKHQYYSSIFGDSYIVKNQPNVIKDQWGVYDEFLFLEMFEQLKKSKTPLFMFNVTATNHTPYDLPSTFTPYDITMKEDIINDKIKADKPKALEYFKSFQYSCSQLGKFIRRVRESEFGKNTIIVATGDHTNLEFFNFTNKNLLQKRAVPLLMYIPKSYMPKKSINTDKFGSHKDIFPTLFNLALSNANYQRNGSDLLTDSNNDFNFSINNRGLVINDDGAILLAGKNLYYKWKDKNKKELMITNLNESPKLKLLMNKARAYNAIMGYSIKNDILNNSNTAPK